jgi:hypothetical protein
MSNFFAFLIHECVESIGFTSKLFILATYGMVLRREIRFFFAYFHVLGPFMAKKHDLSDNFFPSVMRRCRCDTKFGSRLHISI